MSSRCRVSVACRGCLRADITSLRQDILVCLLLSASPVLSQTSCNRATLGRRVQGHPIRHAYAKQRTAKRVIMADKYLVDSDVDAMDGFLSPFR